MKTPGQDKSDLEGEETEVVDDVGWENPPPVEIVICGETGSFDYKQEGKNTNVERNGQQDSNNNTCFMVAFAAAGLGVIAAAIFLLFHLRKENS